MITIDGSSLTIEDVVSIARHDERVQFSEDESFWDNLRQSRAFLESYLEKGYPVYGVTTGFGDSCHNQINTVKSEDLQKSLVSFHGIGLGNDFSREEGRAIVLVRLNSNIKGMSAIREETVQLMLGLINEDVIPVIPEMGSVGASGDLTPLSYVAAVLMGDRKAYYNGKSVKAADALDAAGLKPVQLQAKEGLALMNGTSVMTAVAAMAWYDCSRLATISDFLTAATVEILQGNDIPFRAKVAEVKNHAGQIESAGYIYSIIADSKRARHYETLLDELGSIEDDHYKIHDVKIQDRYSLRCAPQVNGAVRDTISMTRVWIENEINSANDNPLIDPVDKTVYNSGNFYGGHISAACDYLRQSLTRLADLSDKQSALIIDGKFNGLTENLIPEMEDDSPMCGLQHGFKAAQITISAISSEIQYMASPVALHSRPTESLNQDIVSLGTISARKLRDTVDLLYRQTAVHLLAILQAIDIIGVDNFSTFTKTIYDDVRIFTSFVESDRALDNEADRVTAYLRSSDRFLSWPGDIAQQS
jgi:phenylalanine ammonia-lyase